jgi:hypothetical protein
MKLKDNTQRAKTAILFTWIVMAIEIIAIISSYLQYDLLQTVANGGFVSDSEANANDIREQIIGVIQTIAYIISLITFIMWFRRAYYNLHQKVSNLKYSEGWAAGSWFVPIICLYWPYQIMKEIYVETKTFFKERGLSEQVHYSTNYLGWWWTLWIITTFISQFILRVTLKGSDTIDSFITLTMAQMVASILEIPLAIITVKVIKDYAKVEPVFSQIIDEAGIKVENNIDTEIANNNFTHTLQ